jgi:hypothetical protein
MLSLEANSSPTRIRDQHLPVQENLMLRASEKRLEEATMVHRDDLSRGGSILGGAAVTCGAAIAASHSAIATIGSRRQSEPAPAARSAEMVTVQPELLHP